MCIWWRERSYHFVVGIAANGWTVNQGEDWRVLEGEWRIVSSAWRLIGVGGVGREAGVETRRLLKVWYVLNCPELRAAIGRARVSKQVWINWRIEMVSSDVCIGQRDGHLVIVIYDPSTVANARRGERGEGGRGRGGAWCSHVDNQTGNCFFPCFFSFFQKGKIKGG